MAHALLKTLSMKSAFVAVATASVVIVACVGGTDSGAGGDAGNNGSSSSSSSSSGSSSGNGSSSSSGNGSSSSSSSSTSSSSGGTDAAADHANSTRVPTNHRAAATPCDHNRGPGNADTQIQGAQCAKDADCTQGTDGRCLQTIVAAHTNYCSYDTCFADTDCVTNASPNQTCVCRETSSDSNRCSAGNCKVDADCGVNGYCSPSVAFDKTNFGISGYYCHTSNDACVDDSDCADAGGAQSGSEKCAYDDQGTHSWSCSNHAFLPP